MPKLTVKDEILASLRIDGPASHAELVGRIERNVETLRRELTAMVARHEIQVLGRQPRQGKAGRGAYRYACHASEPIALQAPSYTIVLHNGHTISGIEPLPLLFSDSATTLPPSALHWNPEHQWLWRNGLRSNGLS